MDRVIIFSQPLVAVAEVFITALEVAVFACLTTAVAVFGCDEYEK